jgi:hypothetical protein
VLKAGPEERDDAKCQDGFLYPVPMPERAREWARRIHFGADRTVSLDWGTELWNWDTSWYESAEAIAAALRRAGHTFDDELVLYEATRSLLPDVVDAAGGVERSHEHLHQAMARAQETYIHWRSQFPDLGDFEGMSDPSIEDAWNAVEELLVWARTLDDRLRRPALDRRRYKDQGLIPALADGARRNAIIRARDRLLAAGVDEARYLSGLNLHMQPIQAGTKRGTVRSGHIVLPFPDRVMMPVIHRVQLTFNDNRDAVSFANRIMGAVECFMEELFSAFEEHLPERFKSA